MQKLMGEGSASGGANVMSRRDEWFALKDSAVRATILNTAKLTHPGHGLDYSLAVTDSARHAKRSRVDEAVILS
jgi:hypothetical protein